jgi:hypothetical protein
MAAGPDPSAPDARRAATRPEHVGLGNRQAHPQLSSRISTGPHRRGGISPRWGRLQQRQSQGDQCSGPVQPPRHRQVGAGEALPAATGTSDSAPEAAARTRAGNRPPMTGFFPSRRPRRVTNPGNVLPGRFLHSALSGLAGSFNSLDEGRRRDRNCPIPFDGSGTGQSGLSDRNDGSPTVLDVSGTLISSRGSRFVPARHRHRGLGSVMRTTRRCLTVAKPVNTLASDHLGPL